EADPPSHLAQRTADRACPGTPRMLAVAPERVREDRLRRLHVAVEVQILEMKVKWDLHSQKFLHNQIGWFCVSLVRSRFKHSIPEALVEFAVRCQHNAHTQHHARKSLLARPLFDVLDHPLRDALPAIRWQYREPSKVNIIVVDVIEHRANRFVATIREQDMPFLKVFAQIIERLAVDT